MLTVLCFGGSVERDGRADSQHGGALRQVSAHQHVRRYDSLHTGQFQGRGFIAAQEIRVDSCAFPCSIHRDNQNGLVSKCILKEKQ